MSLLDQMAEQRIIEARDRGDFDDLPGQGQRQLLEDDSLVPEHLRAAYRMLRNAGYLPPEMQIRREVKEVEDLLAQIPLDDEAGRDRARRRLELLRLQLAEGRGRRSSAIWMESAYHLRILERMGGERGR